MPGGWVVMGAVLPCDSRWIAGTDRQKSRRSDRVPACWVADESPMDRR